MTKQDEDFNDYYDEREEAIPFAKMIELKQYNYYFCIEQIAAHLRDKKKVSILDVGCADGLLYQHLRDEKFKGIIDGVEISPRGRKEYYKRHPKGTILFDSIDNIKGQYDVVVSTQTLEHLEKPEDILKKMHACARHMIIFTVPNNNAIPSKCHRSIISYYDACMLCENLAPKDYNIYMINRDRKFAANLNCLGVVIFK